ncbi:metal-dependent transcriptional regulator [Ruania albidiflava]|uniref:metal-dependent transcriptional regulator n=1 Tax=Ruania albidiflava TaxID=366586 RepID=UPI0023F38764|nr:metal-dependent transcriptional regulator [Ruania albidiflava]
MSDVYGRSCHGLVLLPGARCHHREVGPAEAVSVEEVDLPESVVTQDYLKAIYNLGEWGEPGATASELAARLGVGAPTVTENVQRLAAAGLVHYQPYRRVTLTDAGQLAALAMVRRHRLIETYLALALGYRWDEVHEDAERLEHSASPLLMRRMDAHLGAPLRDPHGDPIPQLDGRVVTPPAHRLDDVPPGVRVRIARISDTEPDLLREITGAGLGLDDELVAGDGTLSAAATAAVWVVAG